MIVFNKAKALEELIEREGDYVNHPADKGGPTRFGITELVARKWGYKGDMRQLPRDLALMIYDNDYVKYPGIDVIALRSPALAREAMDTGVNMGATVGVQFLQEALNAFNRQGNDWPDLDKVDGRFGGKSDAALAACMRARRSQDWEGVLLAAMNVQQGARYLSIMQRNPRQEAFGWGWFRSRVFLPA